MARERRQPRQPDPRKRKDARTPGKRGAWKSKEEKPFRRDKFPKRKEETGTSEDRPRKDREDQPRENKKAFRGRDDRPSERKGPFKPREENPSDKKRPYKRKDDNASERKGPYKSRREGPSEEKRPFKKKEEGPSDRKGSYKSWKENSSEEKRPYKRRENASDGKDKYGSKERRSSYKPRVKKYTGKGFKEGDYIRKGYREEEAIRLNKYIANSGICSRREADELIKAGVIRVNEAVVTELGTKVLPSDKVYYEGQLIINERKRYLLLNKQKGYVTTTKDPHAENTVMELIAGACKERIYPVGRLDRNTTGLLLFTNDGELSKKLMHPSSRITKLYHVVLDQPLKKADMVKIAAGIELDDGPVKVDGISYDASTTDKRELGLEIHIGKNRVIRRIFAALDYKVVKLDRVIYAGLTKKNLPRGKWRFLTEQEVRALKKL